MDLDIVKKLIKMVDSSGITDLAIEEGELKIRISKRQKNHTTSALPSIQYSSVPEVANSNHEIRIKEKVEEKEDTSKLYEIKSPIVGTLYRAPAPDAEPYVQVGDTVSVGTVLCIVEAMKLMNEIESDIDGKIVKILVENGKPVEYNQPLFLIERF